jgi:hypothetical protein
MNMVSIPGDALKKDDAGDRTRTLGSESER